MEVDEPLIKTSLKCVRNLNYPAQVCKCFRSHTVYGMIVFFDFFVGLKCVGHSYAYVVHFVFLIQ
jgi:hypothetical protein